MPGFVGFDALGTLRYYAGVTELFHRWTQERENAVLHYFDNFPTASVAARAGRLRVFLAKRMARRQIGDSDHVTLVGHSTGGLDIRKLLELIADDEGETPVDGAQPIKNHRMKGVIKRMVFLSVPHYGTNIANYVQSFEATVKHEIANLRDIMRLNQPATSLLRRRLTSWVEPERMQALQAAIDILNETDEDFGLSEAERSTEREARYELLLWLDHMAHEFDAIDDLSVPPSGRPKPNEPRSPAHYAAEQREAEIKAWPTGLQIRSYLVVVGPRQPAQVEVAHQSNAGSHGEEHRPDHEQPRRDVLSRLPEEQHAAHHEQHTRGEVVEVVPDLVASRDLAVPRGERGQLAAKDPSSRVHRARHDSANGQVGARQVPQPDQSVPSAPVLA